jgi:hypothetical protein
MPDIIDQSSTWKEEAMWRLGDEIQIPDCFPEQKKVFLRHVLKFALRGLLGDGKWLTFVQLVLLIILLLVNLILIFKLKKKLLSISPFNVIKKKV